MEEKFEQLFHEIFKANGENELHGIVKSNTLLKDKNNWHPYGGKNEEDKSNFAIFENQQPTAEGALVEKITNSIDALLLKKCRQSRIDPESKDAPETMEEATERFFSVKKGDIGGESNKVNLAKENIQIIATGEKVTPDIMIYDFGEGQHPSKFKDTFLSIGRSNKTNISFVQGKYNMGSTGAVVFCGEYRYQLICSKRDSEIFDIEKELDHNFFGWTLVRRHQLSDIEDENYGSTWYEYFAIDGKTIPYFEGESLNIGLLDDKKFTTGSFVKLYSYKLSRGAASAINASVGGLYKELNQLLYKPALPILVYEKRRDQYQYGSLDSKVVYGNHVRFNHPKKELLEVLPIYERFSNQTMGEVSIQVVVLKKGENSQQQTDRKRIYIGGRSVVYVLNGQVQGHEGRTLITKHLNYHFLKDSMLIMIDCSKMKTNFRQDIFMANRSNLRHSDKAADLRDEVIKILKSNDILKRLNAERKNKALQGGDDVEEKRLIENLLSRIPLDQSLRNLLKRGADMINIMPENTASVRRGNEVRRPIETKRFPSIFKVNLKEEDSTGKKTKTIPLNGKGIINFETDVDEDYFYRPRDRGDFEIHIFGSHNANDSNDGNEKGKPNKVEDIFKVNQSGPNDGSIKLTLNPRENLQVGDEIELNAKLTSPDGDIDCIFYVKIVNPQAPENRQQKEEPERPKLPKVIKVSKKEGRWVKDNGNNDDWDDAEGWDDDRVIQIIPGSEDDAKIVDAIAINMDSNSLKRCIAKNQARTDKQIKVLKDKYISNVYLHGLFLYSILDKLASHNAESKYTLHNTESDEDVDIEDFLSNIFKMYADVLINLDTNKEIIENLDDD